VRVEYRILGPLEALADGRPVALGGRHQRAVLAILLAHANEVVPVDRLIDGIWDEGPPETAANVLQGYVSQLRKLLGRDAIATRGRGYALIAPDGALDLHRFEQHAASGMAEHASGRADGAAAELGAALALWRGPALSDVADLPAVRPIAARLDELRLAALERRIGADIDRSRAAEAAAELDPLVAEHPLRERLRGLQMLALYRGGRQADALAAFRAARATLVDELGLEPSAELQELQRAILQRDPGLAPPGDGAPAGAATVLATALDTASLPLLGALGGPLARHRDGELLLASTVPAAAQLAAVTATLRERSESLSAGGVVARVCAFTSVTPGIDLARLATEQDADLLLVDAPAGLLEDARLIALLEDAPCDVAVVVGDRALRAGPVIVPFSGAEHDWAAVELGAWLAQALERPLQLAGASTGAAGRDASRLLASASLALQRAVGVHADPVIVEPAPAALVAAASAASVVVVGLTERWRREGLGRTRTALATDADAPTLLVRRGLRPGGLAARPGDTRFTWTIAAAGG
jgi:DNA-binding SARP family transcriptional activator